MKNTARMPDSQAQEDDDQDLIAPAPARNDRAHIQAVTKWDGTPLTKTERPAPPPCLDIAMDPSQQQAHELQYTEPSKHGDCPHIKNA